MPRYWRADGGYQDAPAPPPPPPRAVEQPALTPVMLYYPVQSWGFAGPQYVQGPIGVGGLSSPPPPYVTPPPPPPQQQADKPKKDEAKKAVNKYAPPKLDKGVNYMFDREHTMVHIFNKAGPIWKEKYRNDPLQFKIFRVSTNFTVKMVIENVTNKSPEDCKAWAATEVIERGDGVWAKGSTIEYDSDRGKGSLKSMGWTAKRGDSLPPVWLVVHKVDFKKD